MRFDPIRRRMFLTGLGGALAIPLLPSLLPRALRKKVEAQPTSVPKRYVAMKTYNGTPVLDLYPRGTPGFETHGADGTVRLSDPLPVATGRHSSGDEYFGHQTPLSSFAETGISNIFGTGFNAFHERMLLLRGLDFLPNLNHNHGGFLGNLGLRTNGVGGALPGAQINATIDYVMSRSEAVYPSAPAGPRVLHVGTRTNTCSYAPRDPSNPLAVGMGAVQQAQAYTDPRAAFMAVFGEAMEPSDPTGPGPSVRLVDRVLEDYRRASRGPLLSSADRDLLDLHMTHLSELEARLDTMETLTCDTSSPPGSTELGGEFDVDVARTRDFWDAMVDVVVLALSCDATRIVTFDVTKVVVQDAGEDFGMGDSENAGAAGRSNWHLQAHNWDDDAKRWLALGHQWFAEHIVLRMLNRMAEVDTGDGHDLLHHSLLHWGNELSFNHLSYSMPTALWGNAGGVLKPGRYIDYIDHARPTRFRQHDGGVIEGVQYNRLLVTIMQAMGLAPEEYEREPGRGYGELSPIEKDPGAWAVDYDDTNVDQPLPELLT